MNHLTSPNQWSCLPTAFAMVLNVELKDIIQYLGHDGSEIIFPPDPLTGHPKDPFCRRSFHMQEMIAFSMIKCNKTVTPIDKYPVLGVHGYPELTYSLDKVHMDCYLDDFDAVLIVFTKLGKPHAVAWDHLRNECLDPNGLVYPLYYYKLITAWIIK